MTDLAASKSRTRETTVRSNRKKRSFDMQSALARIVIALGALAVWELIARFDLISEFWISRPTLIIPGVFELLSTVEGWEAIGVTVFEAATGLAIALVAGTTVGYLLTRSKLVLTFVNPFIGVLNSVPTFALIPLFILWFGIGSTSKVVLVAVITFFMILVNTINAITSVDQDLMTVARLYGANRRDLRNKVLFPSAVPWLLAALRVCTGMAFAGALVGEMLAGQGGLGYLVASAAAQLDLTTVFVAISVIMIIAFLADSGWLFLERKLLRWRPSSSGG